VIAEITKAPYTSYLPDLMLSDFYLFDFVKLIIAGHSFSDSTELLSAIGAIMDGIGKA
jgi:hypothetical protein